MVKAIMHGCNGHMGRVITDIIKNTEGIELVAGVDKYTKVPNYYPVFESIGACDVEADVIIVLKNRCRSYFVLRDFPKNSWKR